VTIFMMDTNICSFLIRGKSPWAEKRLMELAPRDEVVVSAVTYFELQKGALAKNAPKRLLKEVLTLIARLTAVLPWDRDAAVDAARIHADLSRRGQIIGPNDILIAGHALAGGCVLVTNNTREFERVKGLKLEDWA
jgi:tRNA(fMet)-specific endonuclease VapC